MIHCVKKSLGHAFAVVIVLSTLCGLNCGNGRAPGAETSPPLTVKIESNAASPHEKTSKPDPSRTNAPDENPTPPTSETADPVDTAPKGPCFGFGDIPFGTRTKLRDGRVVVTLLEGMRHRYDEGTRRRDSELPLEIKRNGFVFTLSFGETLRKASKSIAADGRRHSLTSGVPSNGETLTMADGTLAYLDIDEPRPGRQNASLYFADKGGVLALILSQVYPTGHAADREQTPNCDSLFRKVFSRATRGDRTWDLKSPDREFAGRKLPQGYYQYTLYDPEGNVQEYAGIFTPWGKPRIELSIIHGGPLYDAVGSKTAKKITGHTLVGIPVVWTIDVWELHGERYFEAETQSPVKGRVVKSPLGAAYDHDLQARVIAPDKATLFKNMKLLK